MAQRFSLKGTLWEIRTALRRVGNPKHDIIVDETEKIHEYLAAYHKMDKEEIAKIMADSERENGKDG